MAAVRGLQIPERGVQCPEVWKLLTLWGGGWNPNLAVQLWLKLLLDLNVRAMRGIWTTLPMLIPKTCRSVLRVSHRPAADTG